eukprot:gene7260-biopygen19535
MPLPLLGLKIFERVCGHSGEELQESHETVIFDQVPRVDKGERRIVPGRFSASSLAGSHPTTLPLYGDFFVARATKVSRAPPAAIRCAVVRECDRELHVAPPTRGWFADGGWGAARARACACALPFLPPETVLWEEQARGVRGG